MSSINSPMPNKDSSGATVMSWSTLMLVVGLGLILIGAMLGIHHLAQAGLPDPVSKSRRHATPLLDAVAQRDLTSATKLVQTGVRPDDPKASASPLVQAITSFDGAQMYCDKPMVKLLLQYGADPNRLDPLTGASPLEAALVRDDSACAEDLRHAGANPRILNSAGETILASAVVAAARTGNMDMIDLALSYGLSPSARDERGMTALHHAVFARSPEVVKALLQRGTDPCIPDANGNTPLEYAKSIRSGAHLSADLIAVLTSATVCDVRKSS